MADKPYVLNKLENAVYHDGDTAKDFSGNALEFGKQPDWNQTDTTALDYIKNKPTVNTAESYNWTIDKDSSSYVVGSIIAATDWHSFYFSGFKFDNSSTIIITLSQSATDEQVEACKNAKFQFQFPADGGDSRIAYRVMGDVPTVDMPFVLTRI